MLVGLKANTERTGLGLSTRNAIPRIEQYGPHDLACRGVNADTVQRAVSADSKYYSMSMDAALATVILHELGHIVNGHTKMTTVSGEESKRNETEADDFIAPAAALAGQTPSYGMNILYMISTQGASLDWERNSDHPLGARRALRLFESFRHELATSAVLRDRLDPANRRRKIELLDDKISRLQSCVSLIDRGRPCVQDGS